MNDGSPQRKPRRSQRAKPNQQQLTIRPPPESLDRPTDTTSKVTTSDELDPEATPRPSRDSTRGKASTANYSKSLSDQATLFDRPSLPSSRSSTSTTSKRSTSPVKNLSALRHAGVTYRPLEGHSPLGPAGNTLFQDLDE
ncbi:unnamed protein product, partial [Fusarium langsethiae]